MVVFFSFFSRKLSTHRPLRDLLLCFSLSACPVFVDFMITNGEIVPNARVNVQQCVNENNEP